MKLILIDVCTSDYFRGFDGVCYAVPVDGKTTGKQLWNGIYDEWNASFDPFNDENEFKQMMVNLFKNVEDMDLPIFPTLEICDEDEEPPYAYFGVVED